MPELSAEDAGAATSASRHAIVLASLVSVMTAVPLFLVGALSVQVRADLAFGPAALGAAIAASRAAGALFAGPLGHVADRIGAIRAMRLALLMGAVGAGGIALLARSWSLLAIGMAICGASSSFGQSAANRYLVRIVKQTRHGLAFGIKQAAIPAAAMLSGLMVPLIGLTLGWRAAFGLTAAAGVVVMLRLPPPAPRSGGSRTASFDEPPPRRGPLFVVTLALMCAMAPASALAAFTVESAVDAGLDVATAAWLLTAGSLAAIVWRVVVGFWSDRLLDGHLKLVAAMLSAGSAGYVMLSFGQPWSLVVGTIVGFALGWGFNGLFWFAIVRLHRSAPATATGMVMPGGMLGGVIGPPGFGLIVERSSFHVAWLVAGGLGLLSAALMLAGLRLLLRSRA